MELFERIMAVYPEITQSDFYPEGCIRLQNNSDGDGPFIASWNHPTLPEPTAEQLEAAS